jgi:hypothetical protein
LRESLINNRRSLTDTIINISYHEDHILFSSIPLDMTLIEVNKTKKDLCRDKFHKSNARRYVSKTTRVK